MSKRARIEELEHKVQDLEERLRSIEQNRYWFHWAYLPWYPYPYTEPHYTPYQYTITVGATPTDVADDITEVFDGLVEHYDEVTR